MNVLSSRKKLLARVAVPIVATALVATACSSAHKASDPPGSAAAGAKPAAAQAAVTVKVLQGPLGRYLVDGSGRALYLFAADTGSSSACAGACATYWPPLTATGSVTPSGGASAADLATIKRADGTKQVSYAGHPLYYYAGDKQRGETDGQGINEFGALWWLVAPSGQKITTASADDSSASSGEDAGGGWS
jgi:predicted lipoprotein with Yx(FWY)xxD motif